MAAGAPIRICAVAGDGDAEVHAQAHAFTDDVGLAEELQWCVHAQPRAFHTCLGGQVGQHLESPHELGTAIGVARVVHRIDATEQIVGADDLGPTERQRQHDGVARGHIRNGDTVAASVGDLDVVGQGRAADAAQVHVDHLVRNDALRGSNARCSVQFRRMALAITNAQRVDGKALLLRECDDGGGIHATGQ